MATCTGRDTPLEVALAPETLASRDQFFICRRRRFQLLLREVKRQAFHVLNAQRGGHAGHDGVVANSGLAVIGLELGQLLEQVLRCLLYTSRCV